MSEAQNKNTVCTLKCKGNNVEEVNIRNLWLYVIFFKRLQQKYFVSGGSLVILCIFYLLQIHLPVDAHAIVFALQTALLKACQLLLFVHPDS